MILKSKKELWTIPNILTYIRFLLIPVLVWLYCVKADYLIAAVVFTVSGLTDIADGAIARKYGLVTDWGKIIDPVVDKLTQFSLACCIATRYDAMVFLVCLLVVKELYMAVMGLVVLRKTDKINGAKWYGKLSTVVFYVVVMVLTLYINIPVVFANILIAVSAAFMLLSIAGYSAQYIIRLLTTKKKKEERVC